MKRRIIVLLLALVMIVSMATPAFAAERGSTVPALRLSLFASPQHAFIVVENLSFTSFSIMGTTVQAFDVITIGTFEYLSVELNVEKSYSHTYYPLVSLSCPSTTMKLLRSFPSLTTSAIPMVPMIMKQIIVSILL